MISHLYEPVWNSMFLWMRGGKRFVHHLVAILLCQLAFIDLSGKFLIGDTKIFCCIINTSFIFSVNIEKTLHCDYGNDQVNHICTYINQCVIWRPVLCLSSKMSDATNIAGQLSSFTYDKVWSDQIIKKRIRGKWIFIRLGLRNGSQHCTLQLL